MLDGFTFWGKVKSISSRRLNLMRSRFGGPSRVGTWRLGARPARGHLCQMSGSAEPGLMELERRATDRAAYRDKRLAQRDGDRDRPLGGTRRHRQALLYEPQRLTGPGLLGRIVSRGDHAGGSCARRAMSGREIWPSKAEGLYVGVVPVDRLASRVRGPAM